MNTRRGFDALVLTAVAVLGSSAYLTWVSADPGQGRAVVRLDGNDVTDAPITLALAALAAAVVSRLAGTLARRLLCGAIALLGVIAVSTALLVRPDAAELARLRPQLSPVLVDQVDIGTGPAPWLAFAGGLLLIAAGVLGIAAAGRWRRPNTRYERAATPAVGDPWKTIDAGEDPTV